MANSDYITNEADFEIPEGWTETGPHPEAAGGGAPVPSVPVDRFASGSVSSMTLGLETDIAGSKMGGNVPSFRVQPPQPSAIAASNSAAQNIIKQTQVVEGPGVLFETNGIKDPTQDEQNYIAGTGIQISVDNVGNKTWSATATASTPALPLPNSGVYFQARAIVGATSLQTIGDAGTSQQSSGSGSVSSATVPTATDGVNVQLVTGGTSNSATGYFPNNSKIFWAGRNCFYQTRYRFPTSGDISASQVWSGFSDQTPSNLRPVISGSVNIVAILCDFGVLKGIIYNAGTLTSVVLTGTPDTNTHSFAVVMNDTANTTTFYMDGTAIGSISGKNPTGLGFWPTFTLLNATSGGVNVDCNMEYFYAQQDF